MAEDAIAGIPRARLQALEAEESVRFSERTTASQALLKRARESQPDAVPMTWMKSLYRHHPVFVERGDGAWFEDVDGNRYLDMNVVDLAGFLGYAPPAITQAIAERAGSGSSFLLPTEDGIRATELLAERTGIPFWQFTGAASAANTEAIRIARAVTGREKIVMFEGKYHGHIDDTLVQEEAGEIVVEGLGLPTDPTKKARIVPFNDLDALAAALAPGDVACLVAEPMLTNCNVVLPDEDFWNAATSLVRDAGALLVIDEAHTHAFGYGGLTTAWARARHSDHRQGVRNGISVCRLGRSRAAARLSRRSSRPRSCRRVAGHFPGRNDLRQCPRAFACTRRAGGVSHRGGIRGECRARRTVGLRLGENFSCPRP